MTTLKYLISKLISGNDKVAEATVEQITAFGETALPALFGLLDSSNPEERWWALRVLAVIPHPQVPPRLQQGLHDPDPIVRQCAALGLSQQPTVQAIPDLISLLEDKDRLLARLTGDALITAGSPAVPALVETLKNGPQAAKIEAARALALINDQSAIPALFKAWQEDSAIVQHWAEEGLDRMGVGMQFFTPE